jgi:cell division cycle protein 37
MSKPFDYSKWDKIELSDDEDDVHPNIDRESWFRMKHRSRVEREDNEAKDRKNIEQEVRGGRCWGRRKIDKKERFDLVSECCRCGSSLNPSLLLLTSTCLVETRSDGES